VSGNNRSAGVPKILGGDFELGNFILGGPACRDGTGRTASRALLACIDGVPACVRSASPERNGNTPVPLDGDGSGPGIAAVTHTDIDWGRKFLPANGGSIYIDLDHLECATPEVRSARDYVAAHHAMLRIARSAMHRANRALPAGERIVVLANNSDSKGHSYGSHFNVCMERRAWRDMVVSRLHPALFFLAAFQVSGIVITGAGKAGSERGPWVPYQISARADFFETMVSHETSQRRPLVNARDESHCTPRRVSGRLQPTQLARMHLILFDHSLSHVATYLKAGSVQLVLAMIESRRIDRRLMLRWPLEALYRWSRDPELGARARLADGRAVTAVELQLMFLERARAFVDRGECGDRVPEAHAILDLWADTLAQLESRDFDRLARRLDWVRKRMLLERALAASPRLDWTSPEITHLDQIWGSLDEAEGLYWACERGGAVERVCGDAEIDRFVNEPPPDTRAATRADLLRAFADDVEQVDWSHVRVRVAGTPLTFRLPVPFEPARPRLFAAIGESRSLDGQPAKGG